MAQNRQIEIHKPLCITPRLMFGAQIGGAWVSMEAIGETSEGRVRFAYHIDLPPKPRKDGKPSRARGRSYSGDDIKSGAAGMGSDPLEIFGALLDFLSAWVESKNYQTRTGRAGENADLFPDGRGGELFDWADGAINDIDSLRIEIEDTLQALRDGPDGTDTDGLD